MTPSAPLLLWQDCLFAVNLHCQLRVRHLRLDPGACLALVGSNGSGKSLMARALAGELPCSAGECLQPPEAVRLSAEQQQALLAEDWRRRNTDMLEEGEEAGIMTAELLQQVPAGLQQRLDVAKLAPRPYRVLSSGEGRKVLLAQALAMAPPLLVLDEPFAGLDAAARQDLQRLLEELHTGGQAMAIILSRYDEIPRFASALGILSERQLVRCGLPDEILKQQDVAELALSETLRQLPLPARPSAPPSPPTSTPLIRLCRLHIDYDGHSVIAGLDWQVNPGEHWHIAGPNGCGKSTLLSVICGDHPQGYCNDVTLFGRRRGSGESIWEIKSHIGLVSPALHLEHRVSASAQEVVLSGFFDSIGLYDAPGDEQVSLSRCWLERLGMARLAKTPFQRLSFGQQRLLLIARALVKHPPLLILDEPLQGLDPLSRDRIRHFVEELMQSGTTQLLFVSHHADDAPRGLTHRLDFIPQPQGGYAYRQRPLPVPDQPPSVGSPAIRANPPATAGCAG